MRKSIITILILLTSLGFAVDAKAQEFKAGALLGVLPSQVDGDRVGGFYKIGGTGGLFIYRDYKAMGRWQGELVFAMKGARLSPKSRDISIYQISANYIDLNLLYVFRAGSDFNLRMGLSPGVNIYAVEKNINGLEPVDAPGFRNFSTSVTAGLEYYFTEQLFLVWSYNYSIFSIRKGDLSWHNLQFFERNGQYHHYMNFSLGFRF